MNKSSKVDIKDTGTDVATCGSQRSIEYTETYLRIKKNTSDWPQWRVDTHNDNFTISIHSKKIVIKK